MSFFIIWSFQEELFNRELNTILPSTSNLLNLGILYWIVYSLEQNNLYFKFLVPCQNNLRARQEFLLEVRIGYAYKLISELFRMSNGLCVLSYPHVQPLSLNETSFYILRTFSCIDRSGNLFYWSEGGVLPPPRFSIP